MDKRGKQCGVQRTYKNKRVIGSVPPIMSPQGPVLAGNSNPNKRFQNVDAEMSDASSYNGGSPKRGGSVKEGAAAEE